MTEGNHEIRYLTNIRIVGGRFEARRSVVSVFCRREIKLMCWQTGDFTG